jgi:hypothetical protein
MSIELVYPFTTPENYTFDSDVIEISGGEARLKDQRPSNATFYAGYYSSSINGSWGNGVLTGTPIGGASVTGGKLDLTGGTVKYVDYDADLNADSQQIGCIRFLYTPNYTGSPAFFRGMVTIAKQAGAGNENVIQIYHATDGTLYAAFYDDTGTLITSGAFGVWSPTASTEYEIELNWNLTAGLIRLFIDGIQLGSTDTSTGTRDSNIGLLRVGSNPAGSMNADALIDDLVIFSDIQHSSNYTPGQPLPATIYATDDPQLICNAVFRHEGLEGFSEIKTTPGSDQIKYILTKGTVKYYWTGSAWAISDGTYAQSNTAAEIETNRATFTDIAVITEVTVFFHSNTGSTTPSVDVVQINYDFSGSNPDSIETCIVWGYQVQTDTEADPEDIAVYLVNDAVQYKTNITIRREVYAVTPDSNGYWEIELVESDNMDGTQNYVFEIGGERFEREVPDEITANFYELT